jgi:hypothetical protein
MANIPPRPPPLPPDVGFGGPSRKFDWTVFNVIAGGVLFFALIFWGMTHAERKEQRECRAAEQACGLGPSDRVHSVLDGARGMVTWSRCGTVRVRFAASTMRPDDTVEREPYAEVYMACYEVERE